MTPEDLQVTHRILFSSGTGRPKTKADDQTRRTLSVSALARAEFEDLAGAAFALVEHDVNVRVADGSERRCESLVGFPLGRRDDSVAVGRDPAFGGQAS